MKCLDSFGTQIAKTAQLDHSSKIIAETDLLEFMHAEKTDIKIPEQIRIEHYEVSEYLNEQRL
jgi:hypothetical protein